MARKKRSSPLGDLFELVAMLPWWAGICLAIALYFGLHSYATQAVAPVAGSITIFKTLARIFQYVLPVICLAAAAASAWKSRQRKLLVQGVTASDSAAALDGMSWQQFEILVGEGFRQKGYKVLELGGAGPDGGVDLVLVKGSEKFFVQCKQWKAFKVGVTVVRELYGVMASKGAAGGFVITSGTFTADAVEFASGRNVTLMDGEQLFRMLKDAKSAVESDVNAGITLARAATVSAPACPICKSVMVKREAKRGANAGNSFWGCSTYPKCRGTVPL